MKTEIRNTIVVIIITALLGGTAPFWWKNIFPSKTDPLPQRGIKVPTETPGNNSASNANGCPPTTYQVSPINIETTGENAQVLSGDAEIDSDDWTGIELSYRVEKVDNNRELQITIEWYAQEKNRDHSNADTRIKSTKVIPLYKIDGCPGLVIKNITGLELQGSKSMDFNGEIHNLVRFPDCGSLQNIQVQFDGLGSRDDLKQHLIARLVPFSVVLGTKTINHNAL